MKIGFVYESSFATINGSNHLLEATLKRMLSEGHLVYLFQSSFSKDNQNDFPDDFQVENFVYVPIKAKAVEKKKFIQRYLNGLLFSYRFGRELFKYDIDLFFIQSSPTVSFTIKSAMKKKVPIIYNIHDIFPGSAYHLNIIKSKMADKLLRKIQKVGYDSVDKIIVVSEDMKYKLLKEKVNESKISIINTWYDSNTITYVNHENNSFIKENRIDTSKLILQYAGNVGQVFALDEYSKLVNLLKDDKRIEFHIVGSGVNLSLLKEKTRNCNIRFFEWQTQKKLGEVFSYPDFEIIPLHYGVIGNNVPSKMALAMACGKPIINIVEESNYYSMFRNNSIGVSFDQTKIYELAQYIRNCANNKGDLGYDRDKIINFNNNKYNMTKNIDELMKIVHSIQ